MSDLKLATVWLDGCSGCHMSLLDTDERLLDLLKKINLVYSPLVDIKQFPAMADITIVEGSVSTDEDLENLRRVRRQTRTLIALGDCAVTGNVPAVRNSFGPDPCLERAYLHLAEALPRIPHVSLPVLLPKVLPVHEAVAVDMHIPGCPPPADVIYHALSDLVQRKRPDVRKQTRFGR